jgi:CubicO group peptidase (beta-lactamase class C family)
MIRLFFISLFILSSQAFAQTTLKSELETIQKKYNLPSLAAALFQDNKAVEIEAVGVRKIGNSAKLTIDDKFHLGSCTKAMTATLAATFVEDGKLRWNSTLKELLPSDFKIHPDFQNVTYDMLLAHRAGFAKDVDRELYNEISDPDMDTTLARGKVVMKMIKNKPEVTAGDFKYSNVGYILAGFILEVISGKSWEDLMRERIFSQLVMNSCGFGATSDPENLNPLQPWGHFFNKDGILTFKHFDNPSAYGPAGTVHCSMTDWSKFLSMHVDGFNGVDGLIKSETFKKLHTPYPKEDVRYTYGGWSFGKRDWAGGMILSHNGTNELNFSVVWLAPKRNLIFMSVSNLGTDDRDDTTDIPYEATDEAVSILLDRNSKN